MLDLALLGAGWVQAAASFILGIISLLFAFLGYKSEVLCGASCNGPITTILFFIKRMSPGIGRVGFGFCVFFAGFAGKGFFCLGLLKTSAKGFATIAFFLRGPLAISKYLPLLSILCVLEVAFMLFGIRVVIVDFTVVFLCTCFVSSLTGGCVGRLIFCDSGVAFVS